MKKILALVLALMMILSLCACGQTAEKSAADNATEPVEAAAEPITIKIAHMNAETHPASIALQKFKEDVAAASNNTIIIDLYGNSVIGGENEVEQMVEDGSMDASLLMGMGYWQGMDPRVAVDEMPFLFSSKENARNAYDGEFGEMLKGIIHECSGLTVVNFWESGFRYFTNNIRPIYTPEDVPGIKFRSYQGEYRMAMFKALGVDAVPIAMNELFTALQQKTVDGQENPLNTIVASAFCEVQKYLSLSGHIYNTSTLVINTDLWNSLTAEQQEIISTCAADASKYCRELMDENEQSLLEKCKEAGMEINEVDKEAFREALQPVYDLYASQAGADGEKLIAMAQEYNK